MLIIPALAMCVTVTTTNIASLLSHDVHQTCLINFWVDTTFPLQTLEIIVQFIPLLLPKNRLYFILYDVQ